MMHLCLQVLFGIHYILLSTVKAVSPQLVQARVLSFVSFPQDLAQSMEVQGPREDPKYKTWRDSRAVPTLNKDLGLQFIKSLCCSENTTQDQRPPSVVILWHNLLCAQAPCKVMLSCSKVFLCRSLVFKYAFQLTRDQRRKRPYGIP